MEFESLGFTGLKIPRDYLWSSLGNSIVNQSEGVGFQKWAQ